MRFIISFAVDHKLDSFGVALAVVAGCQSLGLNDVHLAFSEDHVWIVWGDQQENAMEVTWHGNNNKNNCVAPFITESRAR
jgi:menin